MSFVTKLNKDEILQGVKQKNAQNLADKISANKTVYDNNAKTITDSYNAQIDEAKDSYEDQYRENAVQKKVNEFYIAEEMANMGLTNSGLNRTQITANQLSYSNNKAKIDMQRQSMVDKLTLEMQGYLTENENTRISAEQSIKDAHEQADLVEATESYNTQLQAEVDAYNAEQERLAKEAEALYDYQTAIDKANISAAAEVQKQAIKSSYSSSQKQQKETEKNSWIIKANKATLSKDMQGSLKDNGVTISEEYDKYGGVIGYTYVDTKSGKSSYFKLGQNPFTGRMNDDLKNENGNYDPSKAFSNGYQPNNVKGNILTKVIGAGGKAVEIEVNGNKQSVWKENGNYYFWDGRNNKYEKLTEGEKLRLGITSRR